jgi:hypothetical protein
MESASVVDALRCAVEMQAAFAESNVPGGEAISPRQLAEN